MLPPWVMTAAFAGLLLSVSPSLDEQEIKFADCPPAVRKTFQAEARGAKIETVTREKDEDDETVYWAEVPLNGKTYAIGVIEDGTLAEMNLAVDDDELPFDRLPKAVQETFKTEAFGEKIGDVGKDFKYGVAIFELVVNHKGKSYQIVVAESGTLVEKVLVIEDEEIELADCPAPVRTAFHEHAKGGAINDITRSTGISHPTYEAEIELHGKVYLIEIDEKGLLISKSLDVGEE